MTTLLDAVGTWLPTQTISLPDNQKLIAGANFFLGRLPAEAPDACVVLQQYEGQAPTFTMGNAVSALEHPRLQLAVRGVREDYPGAYAWTLVLRNIMGSITSQTTLSNLVILRLEPTGVPNPIGYDQVDRPRFTVNFQAHIQPEA